jgi:hypothetical protein
MRSWLLVSSLLVGTLAEFARISRLDIWESKAKNRKVFSYKEGAKLSPSVSLNDSSYVEVELADLTGAKLNPTQVSFLFTDESQGPVVLGTHPTAQVPLKTSAAGGAIYRAEMQLGSIRTHNPRGGLSSVLLIAGDPRGTLTHSLGKVMLAPVEGRMGSTGEGIKELDNWLPHNPIQHTFKPPVATPNSLVTTVFSGLVVMVPVVSFLSGLKKLQLNIKGIWNPTSMIFFVLSGAFVALIVMFFLALNLVQTVAGSLVLAGPLCVVGNRLLRQLRTSGDISS